jgi:hypothetical protein
MSIFRMAERLSADGRIARVSSVYGILTNHNRSRTHLSLGKDSPVPRSVESAKAGKIIALPQVGGLHHRYERPAA